MTLRTRVPAGLVGLGAALLALVACGSGTSTPRGAPTPPSTSATAPVPTGPSGATSAPPSPTFPTPSVVSPTGPPATIQVRLVAYDNQTSTCQGSAWCRKLGWTPALQHQYETTTCTSGDTHPDPDPAKTVVACSTLGEKYILGPAELTNTDVAKASAAYSDSETWAVNIDFTPSGGDTFLGLTKKLMTNNQQYAIVLDGSVVAAPSVFAAGRSAQLTGSEQGFTQNQAEQLAARINAGAGTG